MVVSATAGTFGSGLNAGAAAPREPLWATHVRKFAGGISNGVRASLDPAVQQAQARHLAYLYLPSLVVLYGTGMFVLSRYRITRSQHEGNLRQLQTHISFLQHLRGHTHPLI